VNKTSKFEERLSDIWQESGFFVEISGKSFKLSSLAGKEWGLSNLFQSEKMV